MSNSAIDKFKKQLNSKNTVDEILDDYADELPTADEIESLSSENDENDFQYVFFPSKDITTYDLARILAMTQLAITPEAYEKFPDDLKQYFTTFHDN